MYIFCATSHDVSQRIATAIDSVGSCDGQPLQQMLARVSQRLEQALRSKDVMDLDDSEAGYESEVDMSDGDQDEEDWDSDGPGARRLSNHAKGKGIAAAPEARERIIQDLRNVKSAGFRLSFLANPLSGVDNTVLMISVRIARLGISEEALQAWHLDPSKYFMLLVRYSSGYKTLEQILQSCSFSGTDESVSLRVGVATSHKLGSAEAIAALNDSKATSKEGPSNDAKPDSVESGQPRALSDKGFAPLFIGKPMDDLLGNRLVVILRHRMNYGFGWKGAEDFFNDHQGLTINESDAIDQKYYRRDHSNISQTLPTIVTTDHMEDARFDFSFPLLAMQFALRHLVRCTEFCLVCHCYIDVDFEALKPYVCGKPLCLFQYMAYGFGPSIEHEILTQPSVVDLLISFCYASACQSRLKDLPLGMGLIVPLPTQVSESVVSAFKPHYSGGTIDIDGTGQALNSGNFSKARTDPPRQSARFDVQKQQLVFTPESVDLLKGQRLRPGTWIYLDGGDRGKFHCKVESCGYQTVQVGPAVQRGQSKAQDEQEMPSGVLPTAFSQNSILQQPPTAAAATPPYGPPTDISQMPCVDVWVYDQHFDELENNNMRYRAIKILLDTLPSVEEMQTFLKRKGSDASLATWNERISPAALGLLRWIIASNRSCIVQVDDITGDQERSEERVSGMAGYMQFRFAQGAPDKEQRFITAVKAESLPNNQEYPTIFAWHGSPLYNWHGIVREGLHFNETINGRAFGNGVYHATDVSISMGYSGNNSGRGFNGSGQADPRIWPSSTLRITEALALNEIVNRPDKYVSRQPHLVVAQLDWIQSRYLFVRCTGMEISDEHPKNIIKQDPLYTPKGAYREPVKIPITAVSKSRRPSTKAVSKSLPFGFKRSKVSEKYLTMSVDNLAYVSDDTDAEDLAIFGASPKEERQAAIPGSTEAKGKRANDTDREDSHRNLDPMKTNFRPGTLDVENLPLLDPPSYATSSATRSLQRELQATLKIQESQPLHELGWYVDSEIVTNMYQWIVELHSFDPSIPLFRDLQDRGLKSVIAEIRFGKDYPMSPPFVRIIRPRFLSFMQGGGGHVTAGGALCMELLTNSGWSAVNNIESVLLQVRMALCSTDPKPARLEGRKGDVVREYGQGEAVDAYVRACHAHGWQVPAEFERSFRPGRADHGSIMN